MNDLSRTTDPLSSHLAAEELQSSGRRETQCRLVLEWVERFPDRTSAELARWGDLDRYMVARRLPDLERQGLVKKSGMRPCQTNGRQAVTWRLCGANQQRELF